MKLFEAIYNEGFDYYERYFDTEIKRVVVNKINTKNEYYVPDSRGLYTYILDESIRLSKRNGKCNETVSYGKLQPSNVHIRDNYWTKEGGRYNNNPRKWYIDIETTAYNKIDVESVTEELVLIQLYDTELKTMFILGSREWTNQDKYVKDYEFDVKYVNCKDEIGIFKTFFKLIKSLQPLMVIGWNTCGFDYPFLYNRASKLGLNSDEFSPYNNSKLQQIITNNGMKSYKLHSDGIYYLDYLDIYKKYTYKPQVSYSLDNISSVELNNTKVNHDMYSTFDGFRTGSDYIFPNEAPVNEYDLNMYNLQVKYRDSKDLAVKNEIEDLANDLFVHYGCVDTYLVKQLDDKLQLSNILISIASKMGVTIPDSMGTVKPWSNYINNIAYTENKILPNNDVDEFADTSIKGGYVAEPKKGKHEWVISVDINSAYPNLSMRGFNMSPETYISPPNLPADMRDINLKYFNNEDEEERFKLYIENPELFNHYSNLAKKYNYCLAISGAVFSKNNTGLVPKLVKDIYTDRSKQKKEMLMWSQEAAKYVEGSDDYNYAKYMESQNNTGQMVSKVLINSLYGALGNKYFNLFNINIARAITSNTRFYIHLLNYRLNEHLRKITGNDKDYIVYNDTDSVYVTLQDIVNSLYKGEDDVILKTEFLDNFVKNELDPVIFKCNDELSNILNAYEPEAIKAEREAISDKAVFLAKKKYFMRVFDLEGVRYSKESPYQKRMGIEIIKSSTPPFVKKYLNESINLILDNSEKDMRNWLDTIKKEFNTVPIKDISKTSSVSRIDYNINDKGVPINSRAAIAANNIIDNSDELSARYNNINAGDKIKIVYMQTPNPVGQNVLAFVDDNFIEIFREYVDYDTCWEKYFISPLNIMIEPLGWDMNKRTNTEDW